MNARQLSDLRQSLSDMERIAQVTTGSRQELARQQAEAIRKLLAEFAAREEQEQENKCHTQKP